MLRFNPRFDDTLSNIQKIHGYTFFESMRYMTHTIHTAHTAHRFYAPLILSSFLLVFISGCDTASKDGVNVPLHKAAPKKVAAKTLEPQTVDKKVAKTPKDVFGVGKTPADILAGESKVYGAHFVNKDKPMELAKALEASKSKPGPYKVEAKVKKVCKRAGCWFTLEAANVDAPVRVKMKDYGFFVPLNSDGAEVVIEGTITRKIIPEAEAQHYADDEAAHTKTPPKKVKGPMDTYMFLASAVQMTKKS